jgi:hypothetical protein
LANTWRFIPFQLWNSNFNLKRTRHSCKPIYLISLTLCAFNSWEKQFFHIFHILRESISTSPFSSLCRANSRLVTLLKLIHSYCVLVLTACCNLINFVFRIFLHALNCSHYVQ